LVIVALFTALIGPYLVDWTAYRDTFEREASAYIGRPVSIGGKADLRLLPTPLLSFGDVRIGDADAPEMEMERFRAEVELASLLKGEIRVIRMEIARPHFRIDLAGLAAGNGEPSAKRWRLDPERISLTLLEVEGGTAEIVDSRAERSWRAEDISATIEAGSLRGPGKIDATFELDGKPIVVSVGLGRFTPEDAVPATLILTSPLTPLTLSAEGVLTVPEDGLPLYAGAVTVAGPTETEEEDGEAAAPPSPWTNFRGVGAFEVTPQAVAVSEAQLSYGALERPLVLQGSGRVDLGDVPRFDVSVSARQIDLDRTAGGTANKPLAVDDAMAAIVAWLPDVPAPQLPGSVRLEAQGLVLGGSVLQAVRAELKTAPEGWRVDNLVRRCPGRRNWRSAVTCASPRRRRFAAMRGRSPIGRPRSAPGGAERRDPPPSLNASPSSRMSSSARASSGSPRLSRPPERAPFPDRWSFAASSNPASFSPPSRSARMRPTWSRRARLPSYSPGKTSRPAGSTR
jgi:hypothetical protein